VPSERAVVEQFAHNLTRCKVRAGLSQPKIAERAGLSREEVSLLERGKREPRMTTILKLAAALEVDPAQLWLGIRWRVGSADREGAFVVRAPINRDKRK
jgi:transcriptional regulator with XRE-family HTH domain